MFPSRFFSPRYWAHRFFTHALGAELTSNPDRVRFEFRIRRAASPLTLSVRRREAMTHER
jgi:hypothetical protein